MQSRLFRMNEYARHNKYLPNAAPPSNDPQLNSSIWEEIAPDEMEAVLNDLSTNPIDREDSVRTYTIQRSTNGVVHVQAGLAHNENRKMSPATERPSTELKRKAERVSGSEPNTSKRQDPLTAFGNDPPAPGPAPRTDGRVKVDPSKTGVEIHMDPLATIDTFGNIADNGENTENQQELSPQNIKDKERTHQSQPTDTPLPPQTVVKTPLQSKDGEC